MAPSTPNQRDFYTHYMKSRHPHSPRPSVARYTTPQDILCECRARRDDQVDDFDTASAAREKTRREAMLDLQDLAYQLTHGDTPGQVAT